MSDVAAVLHAHLAGYPGLNALIGTRVYPVQLPNTAVMPAVTYQRIDTMPMQHRSSRRANYGRPRFQIDGWATSYSGAVTLRAQIREAMGDFIKDADPRIDVALLKDDRDIVESSPGRWRCSLDYHIWSED